MSLDMMSIPRNQFLDASTNDASTNNAAKNYNFSKLSRVKTNFILKS